jgi:energy-coupling factor transporter ATP-binding protein EcfA2
MKIAFTGSHGTGKTTAAKILKKVINETHPELTIAPLGSVTRSVLGWGKGDGKLSLSPVGNSFQVACIYERRRQMLSTGSLKADCVISERWAMDETAYQLYKTRKDLMDRYSSHTLRVCQMEVEWELENYWDKIYYIPVDGRPVEEDGTRPGDKKYQVEVGNMLEVVMSPYAKNRKIKVMPTELEAWEPYFKKEVESWKIKK